MKLQEVLARLPFRKYQQIISKFNKLYNTLCRDCQIKAYVAKRQKKMINPEDLCSLCRIGADEILKKPLEDANKWYAKNAIKESAKK